MKRIQAAILAAMMLAVLSACSARNEWTSDDSYSGQQHKEKQEKEERERANQK